MTNRSIGLEITSLCVRMAEVQLGKDGMTLQGMAEEPLPAGAVVAGEVRDPEAVTHTVHTLWNRTGVRGKKVVLGVAGSRVAIRNTTLPWMPEGDISSALSLYVGDVLPFDSAEAVMDFVIDGETTDDEGNRLYTGILVAAALDFIEPMVAAVEAAKLTVVGVDLTAFAILRSSVAHYPWSPGATEVLVNVASQMTQVIVHSNSRPQLVRGLVVGSDSAIEQYARLDPTSPTAGAEALEPLVDEIVTTIEYFKASNQGRPLARLVLTGEGSQLPGIEYAIGSQLQIPIVREAAWLGMPRAKLGVSDQQLHVMANTMGGAVGLAMGVAA